MNIEIRNLSMSYPGLKIFEQLNYSFEAGKVTCLLGPSGCGKTTLLNLLAGTLQATAGTIHPDIRGKVAFIFQESRLLPWMSVLDNVTYLMDETVADKKRWGMELIERVGLLGFEESYPPELSGGMARRVSLARALGKKASLLLMDEPFSSLDDELKDRMVAMMRDLLHGERPTVLHVSHDTRIARELADKIIYMKRLEDRTIIVEKEKDIDE